MNGCCVIGGGGFIGRHVVAALVERGRRVTVIGRTATPMPPFPASVRYVRGDYGDRTFLDGALKGVAEVIDLAYATVPKTSYDDPVFDILSNLPPKVGVFEAAVSLRIRTLVVVSSGGVVYGTADRLPVTEAHSTNPISPYGISKLAIEKYALLYHHSRGLPAVIVRPGNAYGEGQRPFAEQGFIATAMAAILSGRAVTVFGETGTVRDYVHVEDVARGILAALDAGLAGECYNIGTGVGMSNRDLLDVIMPLARASGFEPMIVTRPARPFDVPASVLDAGKLRERTGWAPSIPIRDGLERTWRWQCDANGRAQ
ncbi:MAG TPA: NAD-dependent epimerase/dehydratase family protein [Nitrospiria bacterium]|nr:NAD-dependent epimerase/dehydratase family protein [Nitrospiria bacterium]